MTIHAALHKKNSGSEHEEEHDHAGGGEQEMTLVGAAKESASSETTRRRSRKKYGLVRNVDETNDHSNNSETNDNGLAEEEKDHNDNEEHLVLTMEEAMDRIGYGLVQRRILIAAGLCFGADSMEVMLLSFLSIVLQVEWNLTRDETASIASVVFAGALTGTLILGPTADKLGRKPMFTLTAASTLR